MFRPFPFMCSLALIATWSAPIFAAEPAASTPKVLTRNSSFRLPVRIDDQDRAGLKELKLFMKTGDAPWSCIEAAPPQQKTFTFRAPKDGEYWFHIATVDQQDKMIPAQPDREPPAIIIVVDTQAPKVAVQVDAMPTGQPALRCRVEDINLDPKSIRIELATAEGWRALSSDARHPDLFAVADAAALKSKLRVHAADRAGNSLDKEIDLDASSVQAPAVVPKLEPSQVPSAAPASKTTGQEKAALRTDNVTPASYHSTPTFAPSPAMLNSRKCSMEYRLVNAPARSKLAVWLTADGGRSWQLGGENGDSANVALVQFPGDGLYGYRLIVQLPGEVAASPASGEAPEGSVEVDTVAPEVKLLAVVHAVTEAGGYIHVRWQAKDRNLGDQPVSLYYSLIRNGDWAPIAEQIENTGAFSWKLPASCGPQVYLRIVVRDRAGNLTQSETREPIQLDIGKPRAQVLGWRAAD